MDAETLTAYRARHAAMYLERAEQEEKIRLQVEAQHAEEIALIEAHKAQQRACMTVLLDKIKVDASQSLKDIILHISGYLKEIDASLDEEMHLPEDKALGDLALDVLQSVNDNQYNVNLCLDADDIATLKASLAQVLFAARVVTDPNADIELQIDMDCSRDLMLALQLNEELNQFPVLADPVIIPTRPVRRPRVKRTVPETDENEPPKAPVRRRTRKAKPFQGEEVQEETVVPE